MSFKTAVEYLTKYRAARSKALNNEEVLGWSTTDMTPKGGSSYTPSASGPTLTDLINVFDTSDENTKWQAEYDLMKKHQPYSPKKIQGLRVSIDFLAGCRRDVRIQYGAGPTDRTRNYLDYDRYLYSNLAFLNCTMDKADKTMDIRLK